MDGDGAGVVEGRVSQTASISWSREKTWPGMGSEVGEQVELALGQRELLAVERDRPHRGVDPQRPDLDRRRRLLGRRRDPAQHRVDPRHQFLGREGLDHVVVGAAAQADEPIGLLAARGQQDHRRPACPAVRAAAASPRSHRCRGSITSSTIRSGLCCSAACSAAGPSAAVEGLVSCPLEVAGDDLDDRRLVVDDEHGAMRGLAIGSRPAMCPRPSEAEEAAELGG